MNLNEQRHGRRIITVLALCLIVSSLLTMGFNTVLGKDVTLKLNNKEKKVFTYSNTVGDFLKAEGITVKDNEAVSPALDTPVTEDMEIVISSPKSFEIRDGKTVKIAEAKGSSVKEVLADLHITLGKDDVVKPSLDTIVKEGMSITIDRVVKQVTTVNVELPFETTTNKNDNLFTDEKKVVTPGQAGLRVDTVENTTVNGTPTQTVVLKSEIQKEPVTQVEEVGTKERPQTVPVGKGGEGLNAKKVIVMQATAYDPTAGSKTAMGTRARVGAVAVDPRVIPLGSKLYIESMDGYPSYGYAVAEDTGGAIKGNRIDLFYNTNAQANQFGRRNVKVYVLD